MDNKPPIDLERLKQLKAPKKTKEEEYLEYCRAVDAEEAEKAEEARERENKKGEPFLPKAIEHKPHPSLTDPYWYRRQIINVDDFDEWP